LSKKQLSSKREKLIISNESTDQYVKNKCRIISTANRKSECNLVVNKQHNIEKIIQNKLSKKQLRSNSTKLFLFKGSTEKWTNKVMRSLKCPLYKARTIAEKCMKWALLCRKSNIKYNK